MSVAAEVLVEAITSISLEDPRAVLGRMIEALSQLFPRCAVGACVVDPHDQNALVEMRLPDGASNTGRDPTRLFPGFAQEHIIAIPGIEDSTLHIAGATPLDEDGAELAACRKTAALLGVLLRAAFEMTRETSSELRLAELHAHLIQAEKLASFGQVAAGVIHELANPLTSIVAYADFLAKKARSNGHSPEDVHRLDRIGEAAERILKFSRDLISYARPADGTPGPVSVHEVIDQAVLFCEHDFARNRIELVRRFAPTMPPVRGLSPQLTQVFVNLFTNAAHAMCEHGGQLVVETVVDDAGACIRVTDTGIGIPAEIISRIFEPFFTTKIQGKGTGLGLFIVNDIVKSHGGSVATASTPGEGTTFTIRLPLYEPSPLSAARATVPDR